ncbi:hypothetical protein MKX03_030566, partial [Papaver bracteatum]
PNTCKFSSMFEFMGDTTTLCGHLTLRIIRQWIARLGVRVGEPHRGDYGNSGYFSFAASWRELLWLWLNQYGREFSNGSITTYRIDMYLLWLE